MGHPESSANIKFPVSLIDGDIRKLLEEDGVRFKEDDSLDDPLYDLDVEVGDGIFFFHNSAAYDGEFKELETLLIDKGIPFDRRSYMDWNRPPELRVFRPGNSPEMKAYRQDGAFIDYYFPLDAEADEMVVSVKEIRDIIKKGTVINETEEMQDGSDNLRKANKNKK